MNKQVNKIYTKLTNEKAFNIFLMNLYYEIGYDNDFIDILTNGMSTVNYTLFSPQYGKQLIDSNVIRKHLLVFTEQLGYEKMKTVYDTFLAKNNIEYNKVG